MSDLSRALVDVRRAYRLLHAYQRRANDLFALLVRELEADGLAFDHWYPMGHYPPPKRQTEFFTRWAWDLLPGHQLGVCLRGTTDGHQVVIHAQLIADTAWDEYDGVGEPDPVGFIGEEQARTELRLSLLRSPTGLAEGDARAEVTEKPLVAGEARRFRSDVGEVALWDWAFDVADLESADAVRGKVIQPLRVALGVPTA